ncbi:hypothetical protein ACIQXR_07265 [Peribacillus sp. NPDC097224]|uniref:hypothetical protein n=2 Tax=unclassified Peribacillus TaxID=2675266 RepID=UPI00382BBBDD
MMKTIKFLFASLLLITVLFQGSQTFAEEVVDYNEIAKEMISNYETINEIKTEQADQDNRFVNEMVVMQENAKEELDKRFKAAEKKREKFYSSDQILKASAKDFGISEEDMKKIKELVLAEKTDFENLLLAFENLGQKNHPIAKNIKKESQKKVPKSEIYIDHSVDSQDGKISGGGWPYCLDDNGYGYQNFITSDCYKAIIGYLVCASDSTLGKMDSNLRYCKAYSKNCSPLIGHSKYNHTHAWYQKIP